MSDPILSMRKAAILIASLDSDAAEALLARLPDEQAQLLRAAAADLSDVDDGQQESVLQDFVRSGPRSDADNESSEADDASTEPQPRLAETEGVELDADLARRLGLESLQREAPAPLPEEPKEEPSPFGFLDEATLAELGPFLADEHPQTVAVVVAHLPADRAADLVARMSEALQVDVLRRLVHLDETDPEIIRDVERGLESRLAKRFDPRPARSSGLSIVGDILAATDRRTELKILANVHRRDPSLVEFLDGPQPSFAHLEQLSDAAWAHILHAADSQLVVLALAGASPTLVGRILHGMPPRDAKSLTHALDHLGPTRLSDVEAAQCDLAHLARQLHYEGRIHLPVAAHSASAASVG